MSRIGKQIIEIPNGTEVKIENNTISVKGKEGTLVKDLDVSVIEVKVEGNQITLEPKRNSKIAKSLWGTYASHIQNMINGVNKPFEKKLILEGVGYKADLKGKNLEMALGYSHPVIMEIPEGLNVTVEKNNITVSGADKELVGSFTANVRSKREPEPYKGKGFRYDDEVIRRKEGKKTV